VEPRRAADQGLFAEIIGRHFSTFYRPQDAKSGLCERELEIAQRDGRFEDIGWRVRKDGSLFWAHVVITAVRDASGALIGYGKVTKDLTDRAYRAFVEATNAMVWSTDSTGQPISDSPGWREFTGQTEKEWFDRRAWDAIHPEDLAEVQRAWPRAREEKTKFEAEFRLRRRDGEYVWMAARAVPLFHPDGTVREWFGVTFDVSQRRRAELERERALSSLETTLESIGDAVIATDVSGKITFMNPRSSSPTSACPRWTATACCAKCARSRPTRAAGRRPSP
jgi:PAS domain S-box-containing protein